MKQLQYKAYEDVIKDIDIPSMKVSGYFSKFGNMDRDRDVIMQGAFAKTIQERGPKSSKPEIAYLLQHDSWKPLGKLLELKEDSYGLYFEAQISDTTYGKDTLKLYRDGVLNQHSIGFQIVKGNEVIEDEREYYQINEVKLWEGSVVTWGANPDTPFLGFMKSLTETEKADRIKLLVKTIRSGDLTDETYSMIEYEIMKLTSVVEKEAVTDTSKINNPIDSINNFKKIIGI